LTCDCSACRRNRLNVARAAAIAALAGALVLMLAGCTGAVKEPVAAIGEVAESQAREAKTVGDVADAMKAEAPICQPKAPETAARLLVWSPLLAGVARELTANREKLQAVQVRLNAEKVEAIKAKDDTAKTIQDLKDKLKAEQNSNSKRGNLLLYICGAVGVGLVALGVYILIQGLAKQGLGIVAAGAAASVMSFMFLKVGLWFWIGLAGICLAGVAYLLVDTIRKQRLGLLNTAQSFDALEQIATTAATIPENTIAATTEAVKELKAGMKATQIKAGIVGLVKKARGK